MQSIPRVSRVKKCERVLRKRVITGSVRTSDSRPGQTSANKSDIWVCTWEGVSKAVPVNLEESIDKSESEA